jgi:hypothetical protein
MRTVLRTRGGLRAVGLAAAVLMAPALAVAQAPAGKSEADASRPGPVVSTPAERAEALAILRDLRELAAAAREDASEPETTGPAADLRARLGLAERVVEPPTITPADIDTMLAEALAESKVAPAKLTSDEEFIRRAYLDVAGKLPSPEEVAAFAREKDPKKRAKLIDRLLDSDDYATNWARYWRDVIAYRATFEQRFLIHYETFEDWLAGQFRENRPWDEIARAMIAGAGSNRETETGHVVFQVAHQAQPVEVAGEVSRIFNGVQIACAQCHDHPTDPWKREQFHEFAAFFAGTRARRENEKIDGRNRAIGIKIVTQGRPRYTMPDLEDPTKSIPVEPKFFFASTEEKVPSNLSAQERRELAAAYVTGQDNPWFAKAFVNRVWYALMGEAFYNPVDDMGPARDPEAGALLDRLATEWARGGYDVKWLYRTLLNTRAYQRQNRSTRTEAGRTAFASACPSRLRADQIVDALQQALGLELDRPAARGGDRRAPQGVAANLVARNRRQGGPRVQLNALFGADPSVPNDEVLGTIPQALFLMNSPLINRAINANRGGMLGQLLAENPDNAAALNALYLRVLSRRPTDGEAKTCLKYLATVGNRREAFEDLLWALINSTEFISRR